MVAPHWGGVSRTRHGVLREAGAQGLKFFPVFRRCQPVTGAVEEQKRHIKTAEIIFRKLRVEAAVFDARARESPPVASVGRHVLFLYGLYETRKSLFRMGFGRKALHKARNGRPRNPGGSDGDKLFNAAVTENGHVHGHVSSHAVPGYGCPADAESTEKSQHISGKLRDCPAVRDCACGAVSAHVRAQDVKVRSQKRPYFPKSIVTRGKAAVQEQERAAVSGLGVVEFQISENDFRHIFLP